MKIGAILLGYNDAGSIGRCVDCLTRQTVSFPICYVDDASRDESVTIARNHGVDAFVILDRSRKDLSHGFPILAQNLNAGLKLLRGFGSFEYYLVIGSDILIPPNYVEKLLERFEDDPRLMVASGHIKGESFNATAPRGAGRIYRMSFWDEYVGEYPERYVWESYAVFKAQSLGFQTRHFLSPEMTTLRPTKEYKGKAGFQFRELNYHPVYVMQYVLGALRHRHLGVALKVLRGYLSSETDVYDADLGSWVYETQKRRLGEKCRSFFGR